MLYVAPPHPHDVRDDDAAREWYVKNFGIEMYEALAEKTIISGFIKDAELGNKRLMSMPDRMTNTIDVVGGG